MTITCITCFQLEGAIMARMLMNLPGVDKLNLIIGGGSLPIKLGTAERFKQDYPKGKVQVIPGIGSSQTFGGQGLDIPRVHIGRGFQYEAIIRALRESKRIILLKDAVELLKLPAGLRFPDQELWIASRPRLMADFTKPEAFTHRRLVGMFPKRIVCVDIESFLAQPKMVIHHLNFEKDPLLKMICENENHIMRDKIEDEANATFCGFRQIHRELGLYDRMRLNIVHEKLAYLTYLIDHPYSGVIGSQIIPFMFTDELRGNFIVKSFIDGANGMETYRLKDPKVGKAYLVQYIHDALKSDK